MDGIIVYRVPSLAPRRANPGFLRRIMHYALYLIMATLVGIYVGRKSKANVVIASSPPDTVYLAGYWISSVLCIPYVASARDTWLENSITLGLASPTAVWVKIFRRARSRAIMNAEALWLTAPRIADILRPSTALPQRITIIPNGYDDAFVPTEPAKREENLLVYLGNFGHAYDFEMMLAALTDLPEFRLELVGSGDIEPTIRERIKALGLEERTRIRVIADKSEVFGLLSSATVGLSPLKSDPALGGVLPIKIIEYLACGLPFVASGDGESRRIASECGAAVHVAATTEAWVNGIREAKRLSSVPQVRAAARAYALQFSVNVIRDRIDEDLRTVVKRTRE